jgi:hypothetical protein
MKHQVDSIDWIRIVPLRLVRGGHDPHGGHLHPGAAAGLMDKQDVANVHLVEGILDAHLGPGGEEPRPFE